MKFQAEIELVDILKREIGKAFSRESIAIFEEVSLGYGIADLVICDLDIENNTIDRDYEILSSFDINIYTIVKKLISVNFQTISNKTRSSKKAITTSINRLIQRGLIQQKDDVITIKREYILPFSNSYAIEAKLKDWKRALQQAHRYKWFAEYSYVVLDEHYSRVAKNNIDSFKKYNIGLATINPEGQFKRIFNPSKQAPYDPIMPILFSEQLMATVI